MKRNKDREKVWKALRGLGLFTVYDIQTITQVDKKFISY